MQNLPVDQPELTSQQALTLLECGEVADLHGLVAWGSNHTFLISVTHEGTTALAIYKPQRGERPLWDFPDGTLCQRERAAYVVSMALGWEIVPPTVLRDGPYGLGSVQLYVEHDPEENYFTFGQQLADQLMRIALFDHIINNADRKGGHCLLDAHGKVWAIDHGVCFSSQPKIRTVIWDFAGEPIREDLLEDTLELCGDQRETTRRELKPLLSQWEIETLFERAMRLTETGVYPHSGPGRSYPWPPV